MKTLNAVVKEHNDWQAIFKKLPLDMGVPKNRQEMANYIDSCLSPENLTCDGELSGAQVRAKYNRFTRAANELYKLDPTVRFCEYTPS